MDASSGNNRPRLVRYSAEADLDLAEIHTHTATIWGIGQADRYIRFLLDRAQSVADGEVDGRTIEGRPGRFLITATWPRGKDGHRIVYETIPEGIYVVRILHTAMDLSRHTLRD